MSIKRNSISYKKLNIINNPQNYQSSLKMENDNLNIEIKKLYSIITNLKNQILTDKNGINSDKKETEIKMLKEKVKDNNKVIEEYIIKSNSYEKEIAKLNDQINSYLENDKREDINYAKLNYKKNDLCLIIHKTISFNLNLKDTNNNNLINENSIFVTEKEGYIKVLNENKVLEQKNKYNSEIIVQKDNEIKNLINKNKQLHEDLIKYINLTKKYTNNINYLKLEKLNLEDIMIAQEENIKKLSSKIKKLIEINKKNSLTIQNNKIYISNLEETLKIVNKQFYNLQNKLKKSLNNSTNSININANEKTILSANNSPKYKKLNIFNYNNKNNKIISLKRYKNNFNGLSYKFDNIIKNNNILNIKSLQINKKPYINSRNYFDAMFNRKNDFQSLRKNESMEIKNIKINSDSNYLDKFEHQNRKIYQRGKSSILLKKNLDLNRKEQQEKENINELKSMFDQIIFDLDKS